MMKLKITLLSLLIILLSVNTSNSQCLVAWYKMDGNAADSSGNNDHGTLYGTIPTTDHYGNPNCALYFNGSSDKMTCPDDFDFQQRSISVWFKTNTFPTTGAWVYDSDHASLVYGHTQIYVISESGINKIMLCVGYNAALFTYDNALADTWYHAAIVVNASYVKYYINGTVIDSVPNTNFGHSSDGDSFAKVGTTRKNDRYFNGSIDDLRIFDCSLKDSDINLIYTSVKDPYTKENNFHLYPNPANDLLYINTTSRSGDEDLVISILDIQGQLLIQQPMNNRSAVIDIRKLAKGAYIVMVRDKESVSAVKFVKE